MFEHLQLKPTHILFKNCKHRVFYGTLKMFYADNFPRVGKLPTPPWRFAPVALTLRRHDAQEDMSDVQQGWSTTNGQRATRANLGRNCWDCRKCCELNDCSFCVNHCLQLLWGPAGGVFVFVDLTFCNLCKGRALRAAQNSQISICCF